MNGILLVYKEKGMTSFDVVFKLRKITGCKKIGHSGTLDPQAEGVMLVFFGNATKLLPYIEDSDKEYIATMKLGIKTLSDDVFSEVIEEKKIEPILNFDEILQSFKGKQKQLPPMISSIKVNGMKLQEYARKNIPVERTLRDVEFYDLETIDEKEMKFRVHCSSGTYIRSLVVDIAAKTNNLGAMSSLIRTKVGKFEIKDCVTLDQVAKKEFMLLDKSVVLEHIKKVKVGNPQDAYHGKRIKLDVKEDIVIIEEDELIAIYRRENGNIFRSERGLW